MRYIHGQDGYYARLILNFCPLIDTYATAGNHFMGFQLRLMNVASDFFVRSNSHKVIAELPARLLGSDDVF